MALPEVKVRVTADTAQAEAGLSRVDKAVTTTAAKTTTATTKTAGMTGALGKLGSVSTQTRSRIQQTSFQLQDIIVQLQGGTRASVALSQQLPQMAGAFGAVGAAIGVGVALGIPAVALAMNALKGESIDLEDQLESLSEAFSTYEGSVTAATMSTEELVEKFGALAPTMKLVLDQVLDFNRAAAISELNAAVSALTDQFGELEGQTVKWTMSGAFGIANIVNTLDEMVSELDITRDQALGVADALRVIQDAEGIDAQISAAAAFNATLIRVFGSAEKVPPILRDAAIAASNAASMAATISTELDGAQRSAVSLNETVGGLAASLAPGIAAAKELAEQLFAAAVQLAIVDSAGTQGRGGAGPGGPMGTVEQFLAGRDPSTNNPIPESFGRSTRTTPSGGGGGQDRDPAIEALMESLQTEDEVLEEWRAAGLQTLASANADEIAALGGHSEAKLRLEAQYQERLAGLRQGYNGDGLAQAGVFFGDMANAMQGGSEKMLRIAKVFGAAQSLINSYKAYTQVLSDPTLPWFAKIPAAVGVLGAGLGMVNAIKGVSPGGGSGGGGAAASPSVPSGGASGGGGSPTNVAISLQGGDMFGRDQVIGLINSINEAVEDGAIVRLV